LKKLSAILLGLLGIVTLSGCSPDDRSGTFYETFVKPMDIFLAKIHEYTGSWGWSIVIITLIIRLLVLPFMLHNYKVQNKARKGQELARPELEVVQKKQQAAKAEIEKLEKDGAKAMIEKTASDFNKASDDAKKAVKELENKPVSDPYREAAEKEGWW